MSAKSEEADHTRSFDKGGEFIAVVAVDLTKFRNADQTKFSN